MSATFYDTLSSATFAVTLPKLLDNCNALRSMFSGGSFPSSPAPVNGQGCYRTDEDVPYLYVAAAWAKLYAGKFFDDADFDFHKALNFRLDALSAIDAPAADTEGQLILNTGLAKFQGNVSDALTETLLSVSDVDYIPVQLPMSAWEPDATNPPTRVGGTKGTTPMARGLLFDATNELASILVQVPFGFSETKDILVRSAWLLAGAETTGDDLDVAIDVVSLQPNNNETPSATSVTSTGTQDTGVSPAAGALVQVTNTLDFDNGTVPIRKNDWLLLEIRRPTLAAVAGAIFMGAVLLVPAGDRVTE